MIRLQSDVPLSGYTTLGVGGRARWLVRAETVADVESVIAWTADRNVRLFVLGGGSNLVIADEGIDGVVLHVGIRGVEWTERDGDTLVRAGAGEPWDELAAAIVSRGLAGVECLSGIPGSAGGTPVQNVGAYGQEVAETIAEVSVFDRSAGHLTTLSGAECGFGYRTSRFKNEDAGRFIVCHVTFAVRPGAPRITYPDLLRHLERTGSSSPGLGDVRRAVLEIRRQKGMVLDPTDPDTRSVGSFFTNPVVSPRVHASIAEAGGAPAPGYCLPGGGVKIPAAWLIEQSGFSRGHRDGRVGLSSKHPLAIINRGGATARDVLGLAARIKRRVVDRFGIWLRPEPVLVGLSDDADATYLQQEAG